MSRRFPLLLLLAGLCLAGPVRAETLTEAHARALQDYYAGRYEKAVQGLQRILAIPVETEDLHYNLGCAYFRLGRMGPAIYEFERALALDPSDEDARFNLETARAQVAAQVKDEIKGARDEPLWVRMVNLLRLRSWAVLFLTLWWTTLAIVFFLRFVAPGPARAALIAVNSLLLALALTTGAGLFGRHYHDRRVQSGIVLPDQVAVREGPDPEAKVSFKLHAGLRVRLQAASNGWTRVRLPNGLEGWVLAGQVGRL